MEWKEFKTILAGESGFPVDDITSRTTLKQEMGMDSFTKVSLVIHFEDLLDIRLPNEGIEAILTVGHLFSLINGEKPCTSSMSEDTMILTAWPQ
jgi:acyl carrier protein